METYRVIYYLPGLFLSMQQAFIEAEEAFEASRALVKHVPGATVVRIDPIINDLLYKEMRTE